MGRKLSRTNKMVKCSNSNCKKLTHSDVKGMGTGLCPSCLEECEMINEHEDGMHEEHVEGCPYCKDEQEEKAGKSS